MKEFDKDNFYILLGLSLIWFYFIFDVKNIVVNLCTAATAFTLYLFVTKIYEERSGFFSTLFFLSMLGAGLGANFSGKGAIGMLLLTLTFLSYLWKRYWLIYFFIIVGINIFGIWFGIFPFVIIFLHCIILGRMERLGQIHFIRGIIVVLAGLMPFHFQQYHNFEINFLPQLFSLTNLLPQKNNYPIQMNGVELLILIGLCMLPWLFFFVKSLLTSISDCRNEEFENHMLLHLWWIIGIVCVFGLGINFYPLIVIICPPIAILLGWSSQRMEKNFNPVREINMAPVWDCLISFILLAIAWHYLGTWNPALVFETNFVAMILLLIAVIAIVAYLKFTDCFLFLLIQIIAGITEICFFYVYFYPVLSV